MQKIEIGGMVFTLASSGIVTKLKPHSGTVVCRRTACFLGIIPFGQDEFETYLHSIVKYIPPERKP